jgi:hypothetical protein
LKVAGRFQAEALKRGLVAFQCAGCVDGVMGDMLLVTPPLVMTRPEIDEMIDIMKDTMRAVQADVLH